MAKSFTIWIPAGLLLASVASFTPALAAAGCAPGYSGLTDPAHARISIQNAPNDQMAVLCSVDPSTVPGITSCAVHAAGNGVWKIYLNSLLYPKQRIAAVSYELAHLPIGYCSDWQVPDGLRFRVAPDSLATVTQDNHPEHTHPAPRPSMHGRGL